MADPRMEPDRRDLSRKNLLVGAVVLGVILVMAFFIVEIRRGDIGPAPEPAASESPAAVP